VYACAAEHPLDSLPQFAAHVAALLLELSDLVQEVEVTLDEHPWTRIGPHTWEGGAGGIRFHRVSAAAGGIRHSGGLRDLLLLRSSGSSFTGYQRDRFTTLPETEDRIMATIVMAEWEHRETPHEEEWTRTRDALVSAFSDHDSPSVQFTLYRMATAALEANSNLERITLRLPNRHHLPFDVSRFEVHPSGRVFHATTEPYGLIEATVERGQGG
jgi:urate oxidase